MKKSTSKPPKQPVNSPAASAVPTAPTKGKGTRGKRDDYDYDPAYYRRKRLQMAMATLVVGMIVISMIITIISPFLQGP